MGMLIELVLKGMVKAGKKVKVGLDEVTKEPGNVQRALLTRILKDAEDSDWGCEYDFSSIHTVEDFQNRIPLTDYDAYSGRVEQLMKGRKRILTGLETVHFNMTSGTLGVPKSIPVTERQVSIFSRFNAKYINYLTADVLGTEWTKGKGFSLAEGTYEVLPCGITRGCASSLHTERMKRMIPFLNMDSAAMMYTSPIEARQPPVPGSYPRYLHARFALAERNITYGNVTFSSYLLEILRYIEAHWEMLCEDIAQGTISHEVDMPEEVRKSVEKRLRPMPKRADELKAIFSKGFEQPRFSEVWKNLRVFVCVGAAGFQPYTDCILKRYFGSGLHILYLGLTASEGFFSAPLRLDDPNSVFVPDSAFFEFIPVVNGERDMSGGLKLLEELEVGRQYEVVVTNTSGLYRYQMKDVIEVTGLYNNTPMMQFVNRSGFAVNMYAEKTSEKALRHTAETVAEEFGLDMYDYCVCPYQDESGGRYIFMFEFRNLPKGVSLSALRDRAEAVLREANPLYAMILDNESCQPMEVKLLQEETFLLYRDLMVMKGASAAQLKPVHVTASPIQQKFFLGLEDKEYAF